MTDYVQAYCKARIDVRISDGCVITFHDRAEVEFIVKEVPGHGEVAFVVAGGLQLALPKATFFKYFKRLN